MGWVEWQVSLLLSRRHRFREDFLFNLKSMEINGLLDTNVNWSKSSTLAIVEDPSTDFNDSSNAGS